MSTKNIKVAVVEGMNAMAWMLVLKNTDVVSLTAEFNETEKVEFEFRLKNPADFDRLKSLMAGKP